MIGSEGGESLDGVSILRQAEPEQVLLLGVLCRVQAGLTRGAKLPTVSLERSCSTGNEIFQTSELRTICDNAVQSLRFGCEGARHRWGLPWEDVGGVWRAVRSRGLPRERRQGAAQRAAAPRQPSLTQTTEGCLHVKIQGPSRVLTGVA